MKSATGQRRLVLVATGFAGAILCGIAGCDSQPLTPRQQPDSLGQGHFIISSPVVNPAPNGTPPFGSSPAVVYLSLPPDAIPNGVTATISDRRAGGVVTVPIVAGGFDPVPLPAAGGDTLAVTVDIGNVAPLSFVFTVPAHARPVVLRTSPPPHKRDVPLNAIIVVVFSQPMDSASLADAIRLHRNGFTIAGTVTIPANGDILQVAFVPAVPLLPLTIYQLEVSNAALGKNGETLETADAVAFTTGSSESNVATVRVSPALLSILTGGHQLMVATPYDAAGAPLAAACTWSTSAATVAAVSSTGQLSALTQGTTLIRATCGGVVGEAAVTVVSAPSGLVFAAISASFQNSCGLTSGGALYCWGSNESGELGTGSTRGPWSCTVATYPYACSLTPAAVAGGLTFTQVSAGPAETCGVTNPGTVYCWGYGYYNNIGLSTEPAPTAIGFGLNFRSVSAGAGFVCGLTTQNAAYCWGEDTFGELGTGSSGEVNPATATPRPVVGGLTFSMLSVGLGQTVCGITANGAAYCWGSNRSAQLGIDTATVAQQCLETWCWSSIPVAVQGGLTFASISAGGNYACGVTTAGAAYCWGGNWDGELGIGTRSGPEQCTIDYYPTFACSSKPVAVTGGLTFASVSAGWGYTCGLTTAGKAWCWGSDRFGALGTDVTSGLDQCSNSIAGSYACSPTPVPVAGGLTFVSLDHTCGITTTGISYCWGDNNVGQLGDGTTTSSLVPVKLAGQP